MRRLLAVAALLVLAAGLGIISYERTRDQLAVLEVCDAARRGDLARALASSEALTGASETGRAAAECRCHALLARDAPGDRQACVALLDSLVDDAEAWTPQPGLAALLIQARRETGRSVEAAALARAAAKAHPAEVALFALELETRAALEPEAELLRELARRIPDAGAEATALRVTLGQRHLLRGDPPGALRVLGTDTPGGPDPAQALWFDTLGIAHAMNDDLASARATYARWERAGGDPREVRARFALALSVSGLEEPDRDLLEVLREALSDALALGDAELAESLAIRRLFTLVARGRAAEAVALYDELAQRLELAGVAREELLRAQRGAELAAAPDAAPPGRLHFELASGTPADADATLWVSPAQDAAPDAPYAAHAIAPGRALVIERRIELAPVRWVLKAGRAAQARSLASGSVYPEPAKTKRVAIEAGPAPEPFAPPSPALAAGDGRRRVAFLLLDCGDWPLLQYLRTRGDLPFLDRLLRTGYRAVLDSDPPLTAAALEALVWPERRGDASVAGTLHRFGVELAGLESVGRNPFAWLGWVLPESQDLFSAIGAGERSAANLLLAHGGVRAGRHGIVTGPNGVRRSLELGATRRPLDGDERRRHPELARPASSLDAHYVETLAAEFDASEELLRAGEVDLLAVRIEPLDILTHAHFADAVREGRDDGRGLLYALYRYIDVRLAALHAHLDADDVLIVASDHGIRTAMEHSRPALFVATGGGVPQGRAGGRPALRGVARVLAALLDVETSWPDSGVAPWATRVLAADAGGAAPAP